MAITEHKLKPAKGADTVTFNEGDWVRFYRNGALVIGEIRYVRRNNIGYLQLSTDLGEIDSRSVIERRSLADFIKGDGYQ